VNIFGQDLITTRNNNLMVDMYLTLEDQSSTASHCLVFTLIGSPSVSFQNDFLLRPVIEEKIVSGLRVIERAPLVADLKSVFAALRDALPSTITVNDVEVDLLALIDKQNLNLTKYLFIDLYGVPESSASGYIALGAGLFVEDVDSVQKAARGSHQTSHAGDMDSIITDLCQTLVDKSFDSIKQQYKGLISTLSYGDADPQTDDLVINSLVMQDAGNPAEKLVQANFTIKKVDFDAITLFGLSLIHTSDNDLTIDATFLLTYQKSADGYHIRLDVQDVSKATFRDYFLGRYVIEQLALSTIQNLEGFSSDISGILADLPLDLDLAGSGPQGFAFPEVIDTLSPYEWDLRLPEGNNLSLVISQDNINWVLAQLLKSGFEWDVYEILSPILGKDFSGFDKNQGDTHETLMRFSVPPVLDLRSSQIRLEVDDLLLKYQLNGEPQWEASVDLDLIIDVKVVNNELGFYLSSIPEKCHFHIMKDNTGKQGIFDHSNLVNDIVEQLPMMLGDDPQGPIFTIGLDAFNPLVVFNSLGNPITVSSGDGFLYIDIDALDVDFSWFKAFLVNS
jgi:hypothetical protein